jgi:pyrroline-5-carboxylate reductase
MSLSSITPDFPIVLIGGGRMGGAMASGWLAAGLAADALHVVDPSPPADVTAELEAAGVSLHAAAPANLKAGLLVIAVKPQVVGSVLPGLRALVGAGTITVSIAAGITIATLAAGLGGAIVRAMPNTPAQIGRGITGAVANSQVDDGGRALASALLSAVGEVVWVEDEALIDAVTAVSGSGPAYVFLLAECLAEAGTKAGLPPHIAAQLATATVAGAGELLGRSKTEPAVLRRNVTSPNGTTEAALKVLMSDTGLQPLMTDAVAAAARRSRELAG